MDAGERRHRAAGAEQADALACPRAAWPRSARRRGARARASAHRRAAGPGLRAPRMPSLSVSDTTPHGALHQLRILGVPSSLIDQHQLGRAAADVEDQRRAVAGLEQLVAAEHGEPRFFLRGDDVEHDAGLAPHALDEIAAVGGAAARFGRDRARPARRCGGAACRRRSRARRPPGPSPRPTARPLRASPSPSRTMREKASMTVKPPSVGRAISSRQLLVPRSIAP